MRRTIAPLAESKIAEIGAGYGRLCRAFDPACYVGLDVNPAAVERARRLNPGYRFQVVGFLEDYEPADLYLAYTVLLHIDDDLISEMIARLCRAASRVVVAEILGKGWRRTGTTPAFSRDRDDYQGLFDNQGFALEEEILRPYHYYPGAKISCLVFRRKNPPPTGLSAFPDDLSDPYLEFSGLYEDGWTAPESSIVLTKPEDANLFEIRGLVPLIDNASFATNLLIEVDGETLVRRKLVPGEFAERLVTNLSRGPHRLQLSCTRAQQLPIPDGRIVGILVRSIGFWSSST